MKTNHLNLKKIGIILIVLSVIMIAFLIIYIMRVFDSSRPDIYEIPGTEISYTNTGSKYYMMLRAPDSEDEILSLAKAYIEKNGIQHTITDYEQNYYFMIPSFSFPVSFKENASFFVLDDYVTNYIATNCVMRITKSNGNTDVWFNSNALTTKKNQIIIIVGISVSIIVFLILGICCIIKRNKSHTHV